MAARKPSWLAVLVSCGGGTLRARQCGSCMAWLITDTQGVHEDFDSAILSPLDAADALAAGRAISSIEQMFGQIRLRTALSADDGDAFVQRHRCGHAVRGGSPTPDTLPCLFVRSPRSGRLILRKAA